MEQYQRESEKKRNSTSETAKRGGTVPASQRKEEEQYQRNSEKRRNSTSETAKQDGLNLTSTVSLLPCIPVSLHPCVPVSLHPCVPASLHPCVPASLLPCIPASLSPCFPDLSDLPWAPLEKYRTKYTMICGNCTS